MVKKDEIKMSVGLSRKVYEAMLDYVHKNKLQNVRNQLKGTEKKADSLAELIRIACEEKYLKN